MKFYLICVWIFGFNSDYVYFFFRVMCSWLFRIIMVHGIHPWNYLGFSVYFFNVIHVDLSMDLFSYRPKPHWASMALLLNINDMIFFISKLLSSCFLLLLLREFCFPMHMDGHRSINCMWVLHILIESLAIFNWLCLGRWGILFFA
jgi:hypothetical protein